MSRAEADTANGESEGAGSATAAPSEAREGGDPVRRVRRIALAICVLLLAWYLVSDRFTPYTNSARVRAYVVPVVAEVSGYVESVSVENNELVEANEVLIQLQRQRYELAVERAEAALDVAAQDVGAGAEEIQTAEARLAEARTNVEIYRIQAQRIIAIEDTGAVPKATVDQARAEVVKKEAEFDAAQADLERVRKGLGIVGKANPQIRAAVADLERGRLDLDRTTIRSPSKGMITDLQIDEGYFVSAGQPVMTFIAVDEVWIEAFMTENNLGRVKRGDPAEVAFDVAPGRIFAAEVVSVGGGASSGRSSGVGELPSVEAPRGWMRDPQRFPVILRLRESEYADQSGRYTGGLGLRVGSQVDAVVYTSDSWILNALAGAWLRIASLFSYAY
jgi:multidrug resistance efflux pump